MTDKLPHNLLALFAPRPPLRWVAPVDVAPPQRQTAKITGLAAFLPALAAYKETDVYNPTESWLQARDRKKLEKIEKHETGTKEGSVNRESPSRTNIHDRHLHLLFSVKGPIPSLVSLPACTNQSSESTDNPSEDQNIRGDAFKTLIVARLSYDANEHDLEREFGRFGPIERVSLAQEICCSMTSY